MFLLVSMFDGDEMNIHIGQSVQARNELKRIASVKFQIVGVKDSTPIIGCVQDALSGAYLFTQKNIKIKGNIVANFLCNTSSEKKNEIKMDKYYTGQEIFSYIIPEGINNIKIVDNETIFEIANGQLLTGILNKERLSTVGGSIIHYIWDKYGPEKTKRFIDDSQKLVLSFLAYRGFTFGFGDCLLKETIRDQIHTIITNKMIEYKVSLTQYENDTEQLDSKLIEGIFSDDLNTFSTNIAPLIMKSLDNNNNLFVTINSGAKGNSVNCQQMTGMVGQKQMEGIRIKKNVEGRSLPIFHQNDDTPEARGFIIPSLIDGLESYDYFYDAKSSREGLIDTAIKSVTWETPIIIIENNKPKHIQIGKWIDNLINNSNNVERLEEQNMEMLQVNNVLISTTDYKGNVSWGEISAVTRHDPGLQLYEIKTNSGRSVIVTESKSLLIWSDELNEFREMLTPQIKIGDCVPVTLKLENPLIIDKEINGFELNNETGYYLGSYLCNGLIINYDFINSIEYTINNELCIPSIVYNAPNSFIIGFLNVYFENKNNIIKDNEIYIKINNKEIINGLVMLCSRLGIFTKIITIIKNVLYNLIIPLEWTNALYTGKFKKINDIILDDIIEINLVNPKLHKKMYDLTIPKTFNFGLANGLQVRDTAKTGYVQRQLIKGLEDLSIKYDNTNRNSRNVIIQYVYGENGINQSCQTKLIISSVLMSNQEIDETFGFTDKELSKVKGKNIKEFNKYYLAKIKKYRDELRIIQIKANNNYGIVEDKYMLPVNLYRLTQDYSNKKENFELTPQEIDDGIEELLNSSDTRLLPVLKEKDDRSLKYLLEIALHDYLCPKKCIFKYGLSKKQFNNLLEEIKMNFIKALIEPGEMVGIIAAQSIGEPTSQMSLAYDEVIKIIIHNKNTNKTILSSIKIGSFCDTIINNNPELTFNTGHINSVESEINSLENEYYIIGVDKKEKTQWNKISHISRHPVNGQMMKVITKSGRIVHTTLSHSHLIRENQTVEPILGKDLKIGMRIPVAKHIDNIFIEKYIEIDNIKYELDYLFGWSVGAYLGEKFMNNINLTCTSENYIKNKKLFASRINNETLFKLIDKKVPNFAFVAPNEFKAGLIQAFIDSDSNFNDKLNYKIVAYNYSKQIIKDISLLLNYFDIFGSIESRDIKGINMYYLSIPTKYAQIYKQHIGSLLYSDNLDIIVEYASKCSLYNLYDDIDKINGLSDIIVDCDKKLNVEIENKLEKLEIEENINRYTLEKYIKMFESHENIDKIQDNLLILKQALNSNVIWDEVIKIEIYTPPQDEYVYDFTVPENQTFMTDNGIIVHNTLNTKHSAGSKSKSKTTSGVQRIEELLHYSKDIKTPEMKVYFNDNISNDKAQINNISSYFKHLSIKELLDSAEIYYDLNDGSELSNVLKNDNVSNPFFINNQKIEISNLPIVYRLKLNIEKLYNKKIALLDIKTKFLYFWKNNFLNIKNLKKNEKDIFSKISKCAILNNTDAIDQIIHIRFNMSSFNYNVLTEFLKIIIEQITLKGVDNINDIDPPEYELKTIIDKETGAINQENKEYVVYTSGINIEKLKYIRGVNISRTTCNDVATIYKLYGIEAARQCLLNEFMNTFKVGNAKINHNHMSVLVDMMTHMGNIISIDRHGLRKVESDTFTKASFENTMDHFVNAAIFNERDTCESVSSRILLGRVIPGGTGAFSLLLDTEKLERSEYTKSESGGRVTFTLLEEESIFKDVINYGILNNDVFIPK